ncbi:MAG: flagellar biosynthesis protein FlhF [Herminiimonas sp.]|nr:flagellar biosynthesis protein FlhF [Herminiimonas sp.]
MNVKKFSASTTREALRMVREALGADAVILSNRNVSGMVEILALAGDDMSEIAPTPPERKVLSEPVLAAFAVRQKVVAERTESERKEAERKESERKDMERSDGDQASGLAGALESARIASLATAPSSNEFTAMMSEIRSMRGMLESQLAELSWASNQKREPFKSAVLRELLAAGFSATLARFLVEKLPADGTVESGLSWAKSILARNLNIMDNENEILENGGVYALVGPTGVGKTTTTAKLAARCVMRHGPSKLALITTDGYRIGGYEQLRIYGKILGVMVHSVKDEADLRIALDELKGKHTVLIDTVGVSQRDKMVSEQVAMLSSAGTNVKRLLCLPATSTGETLNEVVRSYQGGGLAGCIMTKLDEAATIGSVLDVIIRQKLNLYYVANGQRVPEDLHVANQHYLVDRAFKLKRETAPFAYQDDDLPLVMANASHGMNDRNLRGVSLG